MYRVVCGIISRRNTIICKPIPQKYHVGGDITKSFYTVVQCKKRASASLNKCISSRPCHVAFLEAGVPLWMLITAHPVILSAIAGTWLRWVWRDIPMSTAPEVWELMVAKKRLFITVSLLVSTAAFLIYISGLQRDPISRRRRFIGLNKTQINQLAEMQYQDVKFYLRQTVPQSDERYYRLRKVMKFLLRANKDLQSVQDKEWDILLIDEPFYANALAIHKGKVFVFSGMLQMCNTDDQLAFVLAHEISHVLLLHMPERFSKMHFTDLLLLLPLILMWTILSFRAALITHYLVIYFTELFVHLPAKRKLEYEADSVGLKLAAKACFDVREASVFWYKIQLLLWVSDGKPVEWISTHPGSKARRRRLDKQMPRALRIRDQHSCPKLPATDPRIVISEAYRYSSD